MDRLVRHTILTAALMGGAVVPSAAQTLAPDENSVTMTAPVETRPVALPMQDYCINFMAGFPTDDTVARYQFFRLTQDIALDATPEFNAALKAYGDADFPLDMPVLDVLENIANPVIRQAAPDIVVSSMDHLIRFAQTCRTGLEGQISSLTAFDPSLTNSDSVISEDALFLRQILSDSLVRLGASESPEHVAATASYAQSLIYTRDAIEFAAFTSDIDNLEASYMTDLDGRLARSNDMINSEMDLEITDDSVGIAEDMNKASKDKAKQETIYTLYRILGGN